MPVGRCILGLMRGGEKGNGKAVVAGGMGNTARARPDGEACATRLQDRTWCRSRQGTVSATLPGNVRRSLSGVGGSVDGMSVSEHGARTRGVGNDGEGTGTAG